jgi:holliday junction DNA helicase RuvA
VGYDIKVPGGPPYESLQEGSPLTTFIHSHIREGLFDLYGFLSEGERDLFRILISVSGLGPKSALSILATAPLSTLKEWLDAKDWRAFTSVPGIGTKTAQRLVVELGDKALELRSMMTQSPEMEAREGLKALGFKAVLIEACMKRLKPTPSWTSEEFLKEALREIHARN